MRSLVPVLIFGFLVSNSLGAAQAQTPYTVDYNQKGWVPLGNDVFLETIPAKFKTVQEDTPEDIKNALPTWTIIPATFETISELKVVQDAYQDIKITPAILNEDGTIEEATKVSLIEVPALTKEVTYRKVKTPARPIERTLPNTYHHGLIRMRVSDPIYILRDGTGKEIDRYEDPMAALLYINGK